MATSRILRPTTPGGLLSPSEGDELTPAEELVVQAIAGGTYFNEGEVPTGDVNGSNKTYTLANTPNPSGSLLLYVNGQLMTGGGEDYTLSGDTITMVTAPPGGSNLLAVYRVDPN
jgi:hypothetical protein